MTAVLEPEVDDTSAGARWYHSPELVRLAALVAAVATVGVTLRAGIGSAVVLAVVGCALAAVVRSRRDAAALVLAAVALLSFLVVRDNSWLALCIVFTAGLVGVYAMALGASRQRVFDFEVGALVRLAGRQQSTRPAASLDAASAAEAPPVLAVVRGSVLAAAVVMAFWAILADSDPVFGTWVDLGAVPAWRAFVGAGIAGVFLAAAAVASLDRTSETGEARRRLGMVECTIVLGALNLLFFSFVALRLGNLGEPLSEEAWRSEVRSGFFQLLFVAALTIVLVLTLRRTVRTESPAERRRFRLLAWTTTLLAALIDVIALQRIAEYVHRNFMTPLRWWSFGFGIFLMVVLALVAVRVADRRADRAWMTGAVVVTWIVFVLAMGLLNPDRRMAEYNFDHPRESDGVISLQALFWLSEDATPEIVDRIDALRPLPNTRFERMVDHLCATEPQLSWRHFNFARSDAERVTKELCAP